MLPACPPRYSMNRLPSAVFLFYNSRLRCRRRCRLAPRPSLRTPLAPPPAYPSRQRVGFRSWIPAPARRRLHFRQSFPRLALRTGEQHNINTISSSSSSNHDDDNSMRAGARTIPFFFFVRTTQAVVRIDRLNSDICVSTPFPQQSGPAVDTA